MIPAAAVIAAALIVVAALDPGRWSRLTRRRPLPPAPVPPTVIPLPADATTERMEQAVFDAFFVDTILREFPEYRKDVTA